MNKQTFDGWLHYFKMVTAVTRRLVDQFPADKIHYKPTEGVRTVAEIIAHNYAFMEAGVRTVIDGKFAEVAEPKLADKAAVLAFMDQQVATLLKLWPQVTDAQLGVKIDAWGTQMRGADFITFINDEHWHHRGQLTTYLRMLGIQPVMIYDYQG
jgi:uncharacterized damage-inducible protein DinB